MSGDVVVRRSPLVSAALDRCLERPLAWLEAHADALGLVGDVLVGAPDPATWRSVRSGVPVVFVGAVGPAAPPPLATAAARRADCLVALCDDEAVMLTGLAGRRTRVIVVPPDAPGPAAVTARGVAPFPADADLPALRLVAAAGGVRLADIPDDAPGVRYVAGVGSHPLATARCAAADGAVAVAAPGAHAVREIAAAGGLVARTPLEAVEAALLASGAPALHDALVARGRRPDDAVPPGVAAAVVEALILGVANRTDTAGTVAAA